MTDSSAAPRNPFTRPGFIASAVVIGALLLAVIVVLTTGLLGSPQTSPTPTEGPTDPSEPTASDLSVCGLEGFETTSSLTAAAPANDWELVGTVAAPTSAQSGPGVVDPDGFRSCFAHTAEGALFAAVNFVALGTDATTGPRLVELVAPGEGRDALLEAGSGSGSPSSLRAQVAGFAVHSYTAESVTVDLALNYSTGDLVSLPLRLVWAEGDWKVVMTAEGRPPLAPAPLSNLGGYTPWAGA